jgi:hypothetical protein
MNPAYAQTDLTLVEPTLEESRHNNLGMLGVFLKSKLIKKFIDYLVTVLNLTNQWQSACVWV